VLFSTRPQSDIFGAEDGALMIPINRNPTKSQLRLFAVLVFPLFWILVAFQIHRHAHAPRVAIAVAATAVAISIAGLISLEFMRRVWVAMMVGLSPIGWVISHVLLALVYYLVLAPVGLLLRAAGRDLLHRRFDRAARSYWIDRSAEAPVERYFRQY
jgi:saxitoxin biosynthesis operon SxtJ-like protein